MQGMCSVDHATARRRLRRAITPGAWRRLSRAMAAAVLLLQVPLVMAVPAAADGLPAAVTYTSAGTFPPCPAGTYSVPAGARYIQVVAVGGDGSSGITDPVNGVSSGGAGGTGAKVTAIFPAYPGQALAVVVGRAGNNDTTDAFSGWPDGGDNGFGKGQGGGSSFVTTQPLVASTGCKDIATSHLDRSKMLVLAGGGGGGGGGGTFGSGGNGGNAGANSDFSGQAGSDAYHLVDALNTDCDYGRAGGGGGATFAGTYGSGGCLTSGNGVAGNGFYGGAASFSTFSPVGEGGAGGGGWYGGGSGGPSAGSHGGGGGGAGASYVSAAAHSSSISQATAGPSVTITPLPVPTTTASSGNGVALADWYTTAPTITLSATEAGGPGVATTYYAIDSPACSATNVIACQVYRAPFSVGANGLHTLTWFSVDKLGLDEALQTRSFAVTLTSAGVSAASIGTGTNPTATAGGAAGTAGSISVSATGSGVVGAAVYTADPAGAPVFNSSGAYVDVTVAGSGLSSLTIKDCNLDGGTNVYWNTGTAWQLVSNQTYDPATHCVTMTVDSTTTPTLSQLTGTPIAAGSPPTTTPVATTDDGKPYSSGTWTNHSVTVTFNCTANATPTDPVTRVSNGANQTASGTCSDGLIPPQTDTKTFTGIDIDKTPPACSITVSPTTLWPPDSKAIPITGTVTVGDNLSGIASVVGGPVTSNETLRPGDVLGFTVNTTYASPLKLSAVVNFTGSLVAKRAGNGSGRTYSQMVSVKDQAGNTASCAWTVTVTHDQATAITTAPDGRPSGVLPANAGGATNPSSAPPSR